MGDPAGTNSPECYRFDAPVYFDDLDLNGHLHNARLVVLVEHAQTALFEALGGGWGSVSERHEDLRYVVRVLHVEFLAPVTAPGTLAVSMHADRLGRTSARYGFRCANPGGATVASGYRDVVKVSDGGRPVPWTSRYREVFAELAEGRLPVSPA